MSASDLWRFEQCIVAHYSGEGITQAHVEDLLRGQWTGKLSGKGYSLRECFHGARIPPVEVWGSWNWGLLFVVCLLLWARENIRVDVKNRCWEWVEDFCEKQLRRVGWMGGEAFSRIYSHHQLSPIVCLYRESPEAQVREDLHAWIVTAATALALTSYNGKSAMIGARSVSDPPQHLHHWIGDRILAALRSGTNPYEDDGSLSSKAHRAMWGGYRNTAVGTVFIDRILNEGLFPQDIDNLPGVLGTWELYRYETGVLWVCRDTTGLAVGSTDPGLAGWSGDTPGTHRGGGWHGEGVSFWWGYGDGRRGGGRHYRTTVDVSRLVSLTGDGSVQLSVGEAAQGPLLYRLRWDSSGCRRLDSTEGEVSTGVDDSPVSGQGNDRDTADSSTDLTRPGDLSAPVNWRHLVKDAAFGKPLSDPDDEAVRLVLWRILKTGGSSREILIDLRGHLLLEDGGADREIADAARRLWEVMA